jgi:hypothetical protein
VTDGGALPGDYRDYSVFGLRVRSNVALPELFPASGAAAPDVTIELGSIPMVTQGENDGLNHVNGALVLAIPEVGRYRIEAGNRITVESEPGVPERNVRLFLLGSAFGVLLHQRGLLPLHANAIEIDGRAVAFMGPSGAGKSTLAAWFHDRGFKVIADDVCVVSFGLDGCPHAAPGLPRLRLWAEALELMGRDSQGLNRSFLNDEDEKFDVPMDAASTARSQMPLAAIYLLDQGGEFSIVPLRGIGAADAVFANTYRGGYLAKTSGQKEHWESAVRLVRGTPVFRAIRQWDPTVLEEQCSRLLHHAQELSRTQERTGSGEPAGQS